MSDEVQLVVFIQSGAFQETFTVIFDKGQI